MGISGIMNQVTTILVCKRASIGENITHRIKHKKVSKNIGCRPVFVIKFCGLSAFSQRFLRVTHENGLVLHRAATALPLTSGPNLGIITMWLLV